MMTKPNSVAKTAPLTQVGMPNDASIPAAMLLLWGKFPEPNELMTSATAKKMASQRMFKPRSM